MNKRNIIISVGVTVLAIAWYAFRPELLFINKIVSEEFPGGPAMAAIDKEPVVLTKGNFKGLAHETAGLASIYRLADGKRTLRLTEFATSNGPDVHVYLVAAEVEKGKDARTVLAENRRMPGLGHPLHKPLDPRSVRLFELARETGFYGKYCKLMEAIAKEKNITLNATGAIGALACELGLDWKIVKGLGVMARAIGLVGHILEETRQPMATEIWERMEEEATRHLRK